LSADAADTSETRAGVAPAPPAAHHSEEKFMGLGTILLIVLILLLVGVIPTWPHSRGWGYAPSGVLGVVIVVLIVLLLMGRL
jgi:hypothetical protein